MNERTPGSQQEDINKNASKKRTYDEFAANLISNDNVNKHQLEEEKKAINLKEEEVLECIICIENLKHKKSVIDCGHSFCIECIQYWATIETTCPLCK